MTRNTKLLVAGLTFAALTAGGMAASAHWGGGWKHGMNHGGMMDHGLMGAVCNGNAAEMTDHMLVGLEYKIKPTDAQKSVFDDFKSAARTAAAKAKTACPPEPVKAAAGTPQLPHKNPVERLAVMEARLTAELEAVKTIRPAAEKLYASLTDDQKKAMVSHEHGRGDWGHKADGERGDHMGGEFHHHDWDHHGEKGQNDSSPKTPEKL